MQTEENEINGRDAIDGADVGTNNNLDATIDRSFVHPIHNGPKVDPEQIVVSLLEDQMLFYQKFSEFHESSGLTQIANYAMTILDLFTLYKEVTSKGGFEKVTRDGRWLEVSSALQFSNISSKPPFLLKNLYANLLYQFELIYYGGIRENLSPPPGFPSASNFIKKTSINCPSSTGHCTSEKRKPQNSHCESSEVSVDPGAVVGNTVIGEIETEFDCGYLIKVAVGSENLNGVLYQNENSSVEQFATVPSLMDGVGVLNSDSEPEGLQVRVGYPKQEPKVGLSSKNESKVRSNAGSTLKKEVKKDRRTPKPNTGSKPKKEVKKDQETPKKLRMGSKPKKEVKDEGAPQKPRNPYQVFMCMECVRIKKANKKARNVRQLVIDAWKSLSERDRQPYIEESNRDKARYEREIMTYKGGNITQTRKPKIKVPKVDPSSDDFHEDYHVKLPMEETDNHVMPGGSMPDFTDELMENARKLDASMQIGLEDDFLLLP